MSAALCKKPFLERADALPASSKPGILQPRMTSSFPPTFLFHGSDDDLVVPSQSELTYKQLSYLGIEAELHILDAAIHAIMDSKKPTKLACGAQELRDKAIDFLVGRLL